MRVVVEAGVYGLLRCALAPFELLPLPFALWWARRLGTLGSWLLWPLRRVARHNLQIAFGAALAPAQRRRMIRAAFQHFLMVLVETVQLPALVRSGKFARLLEIEGDLASVRAQAEAGRPPLLVSGHLGVWEWLMAATALHGVPQVGVMRPIQNRFISRWVERRRARAGGGRVVLKKQALQPLLRGAREGLCPAMLIDQNSRKGIFIDFFGRPARTHPVAGQFAARWGFTVHSGVLIRVQPGRRYRLIVEPAVPIETGPAGRDERIHWVTQVLAQRLEAQIRRWPEQYFWLHQRWKDRPDGTRERVR